MEQELSTHSELEHACADFFLSPRWINTYKKHWSTSDFYAQYCDGDRFIRDEQNQESSHRCFALLSKYTYKSALGLKYISIGFNENLNPDLSDITVEINGFLGDTSETLNQSFSPRFKQFIEVLNRNKDWHELRVNSLSSGNADSAIQIAKAQGFICYVTANKASYWTDLDWIRGTANSDYLATRSSNTRSQLRRSLKAIEKSFGTVEIVEPTSLQQALEWLDELALLHDQRWATTSYTEGFKNKNFYAFTREMTAERWNKSELQFLKVRTQSQTVGYIYNYKVDQNIAFMLSGFDYATFAKFKPGLVAHWKAIEYNLAKQVRSYDFLVGTSRYKKSLCTNQTEVVSIAIRRPRWHFVLEHVGRMFKRKILRKSQPVVDD